MVTGNPSAIRTYHARGGRLSPALERALVELAPRYGIPDEPEGLNLPALFDGRPVVMEFGSGMGDATLAMAAARPDTGILAVEVHPPGVATLIREADRAGLGNIRVIMQDGVAVLRDRIGPESLAGFRAYFPDPWPKTKHHKRRLVRPELVTLIASRMLPGAAAEFATDWRPYAEQMLTVLTAEPMLRPIGPGFTPRPDHRPLSKFERRGLARGHDVFDVVFVRR